MNKFAAFQPPTPLLSVVTRTTQHVPCRERERQTVNYLSFPPNKQTRYIFTVVERKLKIDRPVDGCGAEG